MPSTAMAGAPGGQVSPIIPTAKRSRAIGPELGDHPAELHRHRCGGLAVGQRLPAVQGQNRHLQAEGQQQQAHDPALGARRQAHLGQIVVGKAEAVGV